MVDIGVIIPEEELPKKDNRTLEEKLDEVKKALIEKYAGKEKPTTLKELFFDNPDLNLNSVNAWTRELYDISAKEYYLQIGVMSDDPTLIRSAEVTTIIQDIAKDSNMNEDEPNKETIGFSKTDKYKEIEPTSLWLMGRTIKCSDWTQLYVSFVNLLLNQYPGLIQNLSSGSFIENSDDIDLCKETRVHRMRKPVEIDKLFFVETDYPISGLIQRMKALLEYCGLDYKQCKIRYSMKTDEVLDNALEYGHATNKSSKAVGNNQVSDSSKYDEPKNNEKKKPVRIIWNQNETALLIDTYLKISSGEVTKGEAIHSLSTVLRSRAASKGIDIDSDFRNENGITMQLENISLLIEGESAGHRHNSSTFIRTVDLWKNSPTEFGLILKDALEELSSIGIFYYPSEKSKNDLDEIKPLVVDDEPLEEPKIVTCHITAHSNNQNETKGGVVEKERLEKTLLCRYRSGMQFDSIDFENFREMYSTLYDEKLDIDDAELEKRLRLCGIVYKDRLFPAEGIIDNDTKEKLFYYIESSFQSGKKVLYYKAIFEDLSNIFANCYSLTDENMLKSYIEYAAEDNCYYFFPNYMSKEEQVTVDHSAEIEEYLLTAGKPMATNDICSALSHIPRDQVVRIITTDHRFLRNAKGEYFHINIFQITTDEIKQITSIINGFIEKEEYAIWTNVFTIIQEEMPLFLENNLYLSGLGVRNALEQHLEGTFHFESAVISLAKDRFAMRDIFQLYAKHHIKFSADEIYELAKELDSIIYFNALSEVSVRVSHDLFISKDQISFDVAAIDNAINSFMSKDYIRIREIDSFLVFPNVEYEWNEYLLESFVNMYSEKYSLLNNGFALNNVAGVIVKKEGSINEFVDACAAVLADSPISLNKTEALNYLADVNMITRRRFKDLEEAINKAKQIRMRKG